MASCAGLAAMDFTQIAGAPTEITSAATVTINGASYCEVKGEQPLHPAFPAGDGTGLNSSSPWVGKLLHGNETWCTVDGMSVSCREQQ